MSTRSSSVEDRLLRLEQQNARLKIVLGTTIVLALGVSLLTGASRREAERVVQAEKFVIVDEAGKQRAFLAINNERPVLGFLDDRGKPRLWLNEDGLRCDDAKGNRTVDLETTGDIGPTLSLFKDGADKRINLGFVGTNPRLSLNGPSPKVELDSDDNRHIWLMMGGDLHRGASLVFNDDDEYISLGTSIDDKMPSSLKFLHKKEGSATLLSGPGPGYRHMLWTIGKDSVERNVWPIDINKTPPKN